MTRFLSLALISSSLLLASCATKKECSSCTAPKCDKAAKPAACCGKADCKTGDKH